MSYSIKGKPWSYSGAIDVSQCSTSQEVMQKANLDWSVSKCELFGKMPFKFNNEDEQIDIALEVQENGGHVYGDRKSVV